MELLKRSVTGLAALAAAISFSGCSHISYLWQAGVGQLSLYNHERPLEEVISDARTPEKVRERLKWVPEIKKFVETELAAKATGNYTTYVDLKRPYVIWSLSAAPPYELKLKKWSFPIVGSFPYLGFFKEQTAKDWEADYAKQGYDTHVRGVRAYSTLGYLRDPLLSSMLSTREADLVNFVFHETAHSHIYLKGEGSFNEQAASYIGDYGERAWLIKTYGLASKEVKAWEDERVDRRRIGVMLREFADELNAFYGKSAAEPDDTRRHAKQDLFKQFQLRLKQEPFRTKGRTTWVDRLANDLTSNAALLAVLTYEDDQHIFDLLDQKCGGRLKDSLAYLKAFAKAAEHESSSSNTPQALLYKKLQGSDAVCPPKE